MSLIAYTLLAVVAIACTGALLWGVYIDHVRRRRRQRCLSNYRSYAKHERIRKEALRPIGGSFRNSVPEPHLGKPRLP